MKVTSNLVILYLNIAYTTQFGNDLYVNIRQADGTLLTQRMTQCGNGQWQFTYRFEPAGAEYLDYYYSEQKGNEVIHHEWTPHAHRIAISQQGVTQYTTYDTWIDIPEDTYLYSSAFTQCINRRAPRQAYRRPNPAVLRLKVRAPQLRGGERLILCGGHPVLGDWHVDRGIPCIEQAPNEWTCDIDTEYTANQSLDFKFVAVKDGDELNQPMWETEDNRYIRVPQLRRGEIEEHEMSQAFFEIYNVKKAGTLVPVFSLRTEGSFGVGDFGDLKRMVDWVAYTNQRILQVLPINDTTMSHTWGDSYPYSCISIFALHPQYIDLRQLPALKDKKKAKEMESLRKQLNQLQRIDYERMIHAKEEYLQLLFEQEGSATLRSKAFKEWFDEEQHWLVPYAQYCYLRDKNGTADFTQWHDHHTWNEEERGILSNPRTKEYKLVSFFYYVQFLLAEQMKGAHEYARSKNIILKGDIPIGVQRLGCDVWQEPRYFNLNGQAGAPPDDFSVNGQNWGFPTYNWDEILKDDCQWWVRRFQNMQKYFDAYRIDHVLGFFRIWEIPTHSVHGLLGQFQPALGLRPEEVEAYGLEFKKDLFTRPYITQEVLQAVFGDNAAFVRDHFLEPFKDGYYLMKPEYDTQRKVEAWYNAQSAESSSQFIVHSSQLEPPLAGEPPLASRQRGELSTLRDGLYTLISDVLFVRDHKNPELYHPRITAQHSYVFKMLLSDGERRIFNRLYDDYFYKRNNDFWQREAMKKLPKLIEATEMLVCAEDLGMIPPCVPTVMNDLRILSLEVQSMPKEYGLQFGYPDRYPYRSVCTIDSHDMPTLRMWWDEDEVRAQRYYSQMLGRRDEAPHPLPAWLARDIMLRNLQSGSMLCILSLQDWLAISDELKLADASAERINIPANPHHYWRYRMHINIDDMLSNHRFCDDVAEMITQSGR